MRKKWTAKIVILTALAALYLAMGTAAYAETTGNLTESISYVLDDNGNLTITGEGAIPDYNWSNSPFSENSSIKSLNIRIGITRIGECLCRECKNLEEASFPDSLQSIGESAFYNCGLKDISLPDHLTEIGNNAFSRCVDAESIKIPKGLKEIPENAFSWCFSLKSILLPDGIETIKDYAFSGCTDIKTVTIPASVKELREGVFDECYGLEEVTFKGDAPRLSPGLFFADNLTVYYPLQNKTWTAKIMSSGYGGKIKWVGVCSHNAGASVTENRKEPTVFAAGSYDTVVRCKNCGQEMSRKTTTIAKLKPTIKLSAKKKTLKKKKTYTLKVTGLAKGDSVKSYKSSKKGVASVTKKGKIRAIKKGKAVITVTLKSGKTAKCKITVK